MSQNPIFRSSNPPFQGSKEKNVHGKGPKKGGPVYCAFPKVIFEEALLEEYQPYS